MWRCPETTTRAENAASKEQTSKAEESIAWFLFVDHRSYISTNACRFSALGSGSVSFPLHLIDLLRVRLVGSAASWLAVEVTNPKSSFVLIS